MTKSHALGIDIGGTFTDIIIFDQATGQVHKAKELTTHDDPARGVITGVKKALNGKVPPSAIYRTVHATTLFTNSLIERKGAITGLITTEGFRDALEIGRERKYELYDIFIAKPTPLAPRNLRLEVPERMDAQGNPLTPLDETALLAEAKALVAAGVQSLAIVFLHAYANPAHEKAAVKAIAKAHPDLYLSASHEVSPEIREYERTSTTVDQCLRQAAGRALHRAAGLGDRGPRRRRALLYDAVERRPDACRRGQAPPGAAARVRAGGGRAGRCLFRQHGRRKECAGLRHGRHDGQACAGRGRRAACRLPLRGGAREALHRGQRHAGQHLDHRADRDRRRRRQHRACRRAGPAQGRAAKASGSRPGPACYGQGGTGRRP